MLPGTGVGVLVGVDVGVLVGVDVGVLVGFEVGVLVGVLVGFEVGVLVGVLVTSLVSEPPLVELLLRRDFLPVVQPANNKAARTGNKTKVVFFIIKLIISFLLRIEMKSYVFHFYINNYNKKDFVLITKSILFYFLLL